MRFLAYIGAALQHEAISPLASRIEPCFQTKDCLRAGCSTKLLRNELYAKVLPFCFSTQAVAMGVNFLAGQERVPYMLRNEMAEMAAKALLEEGPAN